MNVWPGDPYPLGASFNGEGTNFAVFSEVAERVELCLFDDDGQEMRVDLPETTGFVWHGYLPSIMPGQRYGYRVHGPWDPAQGQRCNPAKLLVDPYAKAVEGGVRWEPAVFGHRADAPDEMDTTDSGPFMPRSVVVDPAFTWGDDQPPGTEFHETVIYEAHIKGLTKLHPDVDADLRGTYAGLAHPAVIEHLLGLGITAVELLPVHQFVQDERLLAAGLRNYWGYNSIAYLAPHNEYSSAGDRGGQVGDFKRMVRALHSAGIEVLLDVVYNHTAEGNHLGPTLSFRGIDNAAYYRLDPADPRHYIDYTGTGNSLNMRQPHALQLVMDSLRYWVLEMHVDGFRFDLAAALARELHEVDRLSAFFDLVQQDPVLSQVKLIAEPWDVGEGGYQVGNFPTRWSEWNGRYRDTVRSLWNTTQAGLGDFAYRITGSSDLYESTGRRPHASINFVTAHDGFTLLDLVSYTQKHNEPNLEGNRDGTNDNRSWNCGVEGGSDDPGVLTCRRRQVRNFLATLFLSQGVPMLLHGDELGRTQGGNNNAYCQDNEISWVDWEHADEDLLEFTRGLIRFRREHPVFHQRRWFEGRAVLGSVNRDVAWFGASGDEMTEPDWKAPSTGSLGVFLNGMAIGSRGRRGERIEDDSFYLLLNAHEATVEFRVPPVLGDCWEVVLDTYDHRASEGTEVRAGSALVLPERSLMVLRRVD
jgi:isoamylase